MPLYDYGCVMCDNEVELFHSMSIERIELCCIQCKNPMLKLLNTGAPKRPDAPWIRTINGIVNDLEFVSRGKEERIETREQARSAINRLYSDPHPRVQALRKRYLERF